MGAKPNNAKYLVDKLSLSPRSKSAIKAKIQMKHNIYEFCLSL